MRGIEFISGLKARRVAARPEGPGLGDGIDFRPVRATRPLSRPYRAVVHCVDDTQGFTLGYHIAGFQPSTIAALKGRNGIARAEGPGWCGAIDLSPVRATRPLSRPYRAVDDGERKSQGFTLGYNITGFQPSTIAALKGRNVIARAEGPGMRPPIYFFKPCKGDTTPHYQPLAALDAESAEVLGNIKALL
jgi:hypothetical protein